MFNPATGVPVAEAIDMDVADAAAKIDAAHAALEGELFDPQDHTAVRASLDPPHPFDLPTATIASERYNSARATVAPGGAMSVIGPRDTRTRPRVCPPRLRSAWQA